MRLVVSHPPVRVRFGLTPEDEQRCRRPRPLYGGWSGPSTAYSRKPGLLMPGFCSLERIVLPLNSHTKTRTEWRKRLGCAGNLARQEGPFVADYWWSICGGILSRLTVLGAMVERINAMLSLTERFFAAQIMVMPKPRGGPWAEGLYSGAPQENGRTRRG